MGITKKIEVAFERMKVAMRLNSKLLITFLIAAGAAAIALFGTLPATAQASRDITWSPDLHLNSLADIPNRLRQPVLEGGQALQLTNGQISLSTHNCTEYLAAAGTGFYPATNFDKKFSASFVKRCFVLRDLQHAKPAAVPSNYHWTAASLSHLPPVLVVGERTETDAAENAEKHGNSWHQFAPSLKITSIEGDLLIVEDDNFAYSLQILARGDFNGDGNQDIAVYGCGEAKHGGSLPCEYFVFSPSNNNSKLTRMTHGSAPYRMKVRIPN